ncbi:MAG: MBL fold metallo-hydrolase [Candidatus Woesearchaeota archaeon]
MRIEFHGAAKEVGRSCIELTTRQGSRFLLDIGVKFGEGGLIFPRKVLDLSHVDGTFISHAHLDHSGGLPLFEHNHLHGPIFCTAQTLEAVKILLRDSYKVARIKHLHPAYDNGDLKQVSRDASLVVFDKWYSHKDIKFMFLNAGHIPGSAMILIELEGRRLLYTGDFNNRTTALLEHELIGSVLRERPLDILITESTYGHRDLPDGVELEVKFIESIKKTLSEGGSIVIPTFALGRAQQILIMLAKANLDVNIYFDGMCNKLTRRILETPSQYIRNKEILSDFFYNKIEWVSSEKRRKDALKNQGIFITTSGMIQGGPVLAYIKELWHDPKNKIMLMGFQCKRTNGRNLIDEGFLYIDGWKTFVKCAVEKYDFSGHADAAGIKRLVSELRPNHVFFQHGDEESVLYLKEWADKTIGGNNYAPGIGDVFNIE